MCTSLRMGLCFEASSLHHLRKTSELYFHHWRQYDSPKHWHICTMVILIVKPTIHTNFSKLFFLTLHVSDSSSVPHQELFTVHTTLVYAIQVCWQLASSQQTCITYTTAVCTVKSSLWWSRSCPKHVEFYSKNKFEKLVYLVGFIIWIYHDARSPERQKHLYKSPRCQIS